MAWRIKTLSIFTFEWIFLFNYFAFYITSIYTRKFFCRLLALASSSSLCLGGWRNMMARLHFDGLEIKFCRTQIFILVAGGFFSCTKNRVVIFISVNVCRTITMKSRISFSLHISSGFSRCVLTMAICIRRDFFSSLKVFFSIAWLDFLRGVVGNKDMEWRHWTPLWKESFWIEIKTRGKWTPAI